MCEYVPSFIVAFINAMHVGITLYLATRSVIFKPCRSVKVSGRMSESVASTVSMREDAPSVHSGSYNQDIDRFAVHCRRLYFSLEPDEESAQYISSTLASLPSSDRAIYSRIQSDIRADAHKHHHETSLTTFHTLLASLTRSLSSAEGCAERTTRLTAFIDKWCLPRNVGIGPFFIALYAVLQVQSRAGGCRVVWQVDDAVFLEAG